MSATRKSLRKSKPTKKYEETFSEQKLRKQTVTENLESNISPEKNNIEFTPPKQRKFENPIHTSPGTSTALLAAKLTLEECVSPKIILNKYQKARKILNTTETKNLPGREKEYTVITNFLLENLKNKTSGSLYISGAPGTGKTACLTKIFNDEILIKKFKKVYINCTSVTSIGKIYNNIADELQLEGLNGKNEIEDYIKSNHKMILLVLDEIDQLAGKKQSILYSIFEWPSLPNSNIILIGIANALDLTDRLLPRLNTRLGLKPKLLHFAPYTKQQLIDIFHQRLRDADVLDLFPPITIQLLAAKVAAISGDVRRALDIGRRVVEIAEKQKNKEGEFDLTELGVAPLDSMNDIKPVQVNQVAQVLNNVYGNEDIEESFPLQQKILIGTILLLLKFDKNKDITVGRLHDVYKKICSTRNINPVDQSEFVGLCDLVETRGILRVQKKKEPRQCRIALQWDEDEVNQTLKDKQLISSILNDIACLSR